MNDNLITTLIVTYQRPKFLKRAILSVLNQKYKNLKVSVFDNASGDETKSVVFNLKNQDDRIVYHCHDKNIGQLANIKYAIQSVDTPYFSILGDDDAIAPDFYENAVKVLDDHPDIMFVVLHTFFIDQNANLLGDKQCTNELKIYRSSDRLKLWNIPTTWSGILFRKEVATIYNDMDARFDMTSDARFIVHAQARYNFAYLSKLGAFFTYHVNSYSAKQRRRFDIIHRSAQSVIYPEIYYDELIPEQIKHEVALMARKWFKPNIKMRFKIFKDAIKASVCAICEDNFSVERMKIESRDLKDSGFYLTGIFINLLNNKKSHIIVKMIFNSYYKKRNVIWKNNMEQLQNSIYKKYFDELKIISRDLTFD